jgi:hypothetical protein
MSHTSTVKPAFLKKHAQSHLKPADTIVKVWEVQRDARNLEDNHTQHNSNIKLVGAQRRRETAQLLQYSELMKATFDCIGNTERIPVSVRCHERNSLDSRENDFLKLIMQSLSCYKRRKTGINSIVLFFQHAQWPYNSSKI